MIETMDYKSYLYFNKKKEQLYKLYMNSKNAYYFSKYKFYRNKIKHLILLTFEFDIQLLHGKSNRRLINYVVINLLEHLAFQPSYLNY